jgi:hypothetical protein
VKYKPNQTENRFKPNWSGSVKSGFLGKKPGNLNPNPDPPTQNSTWSFGSLIQTLATKSESVIEIYKKDLEEFGSGLKNESVIIRDVASHAVHDLPASFEAALPSLRSISRGDGLVWGNMAGFSPLLL